ncbi:hypothetical protein Aduo_010100 [Ancylostoma duodenale]
MLPDHSVTIPSRSTSRKSFSTIPRSIHAATTIIDSGTAEATPREEILLKIRELYQQHPEALFQLLHVTPPVTVDPTATTGAPVAKASDTTVRVKLAQLK